MSQYPQWAIVYAKEKKTHKRTRLVHGAAGLPLLPMVNPDVASQDGLNVTRDSTSPLLRPEAGWTRRFTRSVVVVHHLRRIVRYIRPEISCGFFLKTFFFVFFCCRRYKWQAAVDQVWETLWAHSERLPATQGLGFKETAADPGLYNYSVLQWHTENTSQTELPTTTAPIKAVHRCEQTRKHCAPAKLSVYSSLTQSPSTCQKRTPDPPPTTPTQQKPIKWKLKVVLFKCEPSVTTITYYIFFF